MLTEYKIQKGGDLESESESESGLISGNAAIGIVGVLRDEKPTDDINQPEFRWIN